MDLVRRRLPAGLACLLLLFSLTGCMRFKIATTIVNDNEIHLSMDLGVTKSAAQAAGTTDVCGSASLKDLGASGLKATPYDDGTYIGCRISGTTTLAQTQSTGDSSWTITRDGRDYKFSMKPSGLGDNTEDTGTLTSAVIDDFLISVTFPGKVLSHSGDSTVDGHTVTWKSANDLGQTLTATGRDSSGLPWWVWLILGAAVLAVAGAVTAAVLARRRSRARARAHEAEQAWAAQQSAAMWNAQPWNGQWANQAAWTPTGDLAQPYPPAGGPGQAYSPTGDLGQPYLPTGGPGQPYPPTGGPGQPYPPGDVPGQPYPPGAMSTDATPMGQYPPPSGWQSPTGWQTPGQDPDPHAPMPEDWNPQPAPGGAFPAPAESPGSTGAHVWNSPTPPNEQDPLQRPDGPSPWARPE